MPLSAGKVSSIVLRQMAFDRAMLQSKDIWVQGLLSCSTKNLEHAPNEHNIN